MRVDLPPLVPIIPLTALMLGVCVSRNAYGQLQGYNQARQTQIDQIDMDLAKGLHPWEAVIDATTHRLRPILLTAAAASLGMIPIAPEVFWGPMAYAIIGGLFVATLLTLLFLPALYVAWFGIKEPAKEQQVIAKEPAPAAAL